MAGQVYETTENTVIPVGKYTTESEIPAPATMGVGTSQVGRAMYTSDGALNTLVATIPGVVAGNATNYIPLANAIRKTLMGNSNTRILIVGDSTAAGETAATGANAIAQGFMPRMTEILANSLCPAGWQTHWGGSNRANNATGTSIAFNYADNRILDAPAPWNPFDGNNVLGACIPINSTAASVAPLTFTPTTPTDTIDVYYVDAAGYSNFEVAVGATIIGTKTAVGGAATIRKATFTTGVAAALNTYELRKVAPGNGNFLPIGWEAYNSAVKEITFSNCAVGSTLITSFFAKTPTQPWHSLRVLTDASSEAKFDAVIIDYGINHWAGGLDPSVAFTPALRIAVATLRAANIPVILHYPPASPPDSCSRKSTTCIYRRNTSSSL